MIGNLAPIEPQVIGSEDVVARRGSPRVAVFDPGYPSTLALVCSLARAGVSIHVYYHGRHCPLHLSRYVRRIRPCPDTRDYELFGAWLDRQLEAGAFDTIAPTSDVVCYHIARVVDDLAEPWRARLPARAALLDVLFKDRLAMACARHGIATPVTRMPTSVEEALADAEAIGYPVLLKPRTHIFKSSERGQRVASSAELRRRFLPYALSASEQPLLEAHPQLAWPLLQQYVDPTAHQFSCSGLLDHDGRLIAGAATIKLDQSPSVTGIGTAFASYHHDGFVAACGESARRLLGRGLFELEVLKSGDDGPPLVIDVNPRVFGQIDFDIARGNNLPALWHGSLSTDMACRPQPTRAMVCLYPVPFLLSNLTRIATGPQRLQWLRRTCRLLWRARAWIGWNWRDPLASLWSILRPLRHPSTFIRSHVRERPNGGGP